jgi:hypothetical protein
MNHPHHISERIETIFWIKILKFFDVDSGSGMGKNSDPGSAINIPDPKDWLTDKVPNILHCVFDR